MGVACGWSIRITQVIFYDFCRGQQGSVTVGPTVFRFLAGRGARLKWGQEQSLVNLWWQDSRLPTACRCTDITIQSCRRY